MAEVIWEDNATARLTVLEEAAPGAVDLIFDAVDALELHPLIGRPAEDGLRELVISRGESGYIALYRYDEALEIAFVLAVRHQREAGFSM